MSDFRWKVLPSIVMVFEVVPLGRPKTASTSSSVMPFWMRSKFSRVNRVNAGEPFITGGLAGIVAGEPVVVGGLAGAAGASGGAGAGERVELVRAERPSMNSTSTMSKGLSWAH